MKAWREWDDSIPVRWETPQKKAETTLKQALTQAPALRLPDPEKAFQFYAHKKEGIALGVLTQRLEPEPQPVAYLSNRLNQTAWGWPSCLRNLAAIGILIEDALKFSLGGKLTIFYQPPSETTPKWERPFVYFWSKNPQISSSADGKSRPAYIPLWGS